MKRKPKKIIPNWTTLEGVQMALGIIPPTKEFLEYEDPPAPPMSPEWLAHEEACRANPPTPEQLERGSNICEMG